MSDDLDIPDFLRISAEERRRAWLHSPPRPSAGSRRERTATEVAYYASIEAEKAAKRAADKIRFKLLQARAAEARTERLAIKRAVEKRDR